MRKTINVAIIKEGKLLLVRKEQSWLLPGGKPELNESDLECLCREVREELSETKIKNLRFYQEFEGNSHIGEMFRTRVYFADVDGDLGNPSAEISEYRWIDETKELNLSDMNLKVIDALVREGYLKHNKL